jgi:hypothetical protein
MKRQVFRHVRPFLIQGANDKARPEKSVPGFFVPFVTLPGDAATTKEF